MSASSQRKEMRRVLSEHALMTIPEAAKYLGCSDVTARVMVRDGKIPSVTVGKIEKLDPIDVCLFVAARRRGMTADELVAEYGDHRSLLMARGVYLSMRRKHTPPPLSERGTRVYAMTIAEGGRVKVGIAMNPSDRAKSLSLAAGSEVTVHATTDVMPRPDARAEESRLHELLAEHRLVGEWFADCEDVRAAIYEVMEVV